MLGVYKVPCSWLSMQTGYYKMFILSQACRECNIGGHYIHTHRYGSFMDSLYSMESEREKSVYIAWRVKRRGYSLYIIDIERKK